MWFEIYQKRYHFRRNAPINELTTAGSGQRDGHFKFSSVLPQSSLWKAASRAGTFRIERDGTDKVVVKQPANQNKLHNYSRVHQAHRSLSTATVSQSFSHPVAERCATLLRQSNQCASATKLLVVQFTRQGPYRWTSRIREDPIKFRLIINSTVSSSPPPECLCAEWPRSDQLFAERSSRK